MAVQPSTGDVLAVANRPVESTYNRALEGTLRARAPPSRSSPPPRCCATGSTSATTVECPPTIEAGGRQFKNFEGGAAGAVPFSRDFAVSCNTAFVVARAPPRARRAAPHRARLRPRAHARARAPGRARQGPAGRGRGRARGGDDRPARDRRQPAGDGLVAATVADGRWRAPRLLAADPRRAGPPLAGSERDTLREPDAPRRDRGLRHRSRRHPGRGARARAAPPSSAAATRRPPTRGSSPSATTSRSRCSSSAAAPAGRWRRRSRRASSARSDTLSEGVCRFRRLSVRLRGDHPPQGGTP